MEENENLEESLGENPEERSEEGSEESFEENLSDEGDKENADFDEFVGSDDITKVIGMYQDWFLDYASYVILERAVPAIDDGFKPVQRRIMHSMKDMDDGRYNKVANIVGHTMQYHPHGDASIADALVQLGQKDLLIDTQGNWGNILTGDGAAAPRYIEARLSKFALEVVFNPKTTEWQLSYDGRRKEPVDLPVKFPLLLAQGGEGIAVGLSTKVLPHNFNELIDASIKILKGQSVTIYPDFLTGGVIDVNNYNDGKKGGRIRVRAKISQLDKNTLVITEVPFGMTTSSLIESIIKANDKGKIKIKKIEDNTAEKVEILIHLPAGVSPDKTIDALFAFSSCEIAVSPLCCIIQHNKPIFIGVTEALTYSTDHTVALLKSELEIQLNELHEQWHYSSLERIFIENRIYRDIEEEETWEGVINAIDKGLAPFVSHLKRAVTEEDILKLTEIKIKRISKFDIDKAAQFIASLEDQIAAVKHNLAHLIEYAIDYFKNLKSKYGKGRERKTEIKIFDEIVATKVVLRNEKLYMNREEGFIGTSLKKDEYVGECADIDDVIVFMEDGKMTITKVESKTFVGKNIIHAAVFKKNDTRTVYNLVYRDGKNGPSYIKRFSVTGITRDKVYDLTNGSDQSKILYFSANPNGEAETITVLLRALQRVKKIKWDVDFADILIKGRNSKGNLISKFPVKKIELKVKGISTLKPRKIWLDNTVQRLNVDQRGDLLGEFTPEDRLLIITQSGMARTITPDLNTHFDEDMIILEKWNPNKPISVIYYEGEKARYYVKRFMIEHPNKDESFLSEHPNTRLQIVSTDYRPVAEVQFSKKSMENILVNFEEFIAIKGIKSLGNQLTAEKIKDVNLLESLPYEEPSVDDLEVVDEEVIDSRDIPLIIESTEQEEAENDINEEDEDKDITEEGGQIKLF